MKFRSLFGILVAMFGGMLACVSTPPRQIWPEYAGKSVSFESWAGKFEFPIPTGEIPAKQMQNYDKRPDVYYEGTFDDQGRMTKWKKYLGGKVDFSVGWQYDEQGRAVKRVDDVAR